MTPRSQASSNQPATTHASVGFLQPNPFIRPIFPLYLAARLLRGFCFVWENRTTGLLFFVPAHQLHRC